MAFKIASSPHQTLQQSTSGLMQQVMLATLPGVAAMFYFFGWGSLLQVLLAIVTSVAAEALVLKLRQRQPGPILKDYSAALTGLLLGLSIPPLAPWWIIVIGCLFAVIVAKQLYGGLGFNPFNPAMAGYVLLLVSFPLQMTAWVPPAELWQQPIGLIDSLYLIFTGYSEHGYSLAQLSSNADGVTMATPLDTLKTNLTLGITVSESMQAPIFGGIGGLGWEWVNAGFWLGGMWLIYKKVIAWHIPSGFLTSLLVCSLLWYLLAPDNHASPLFHMLSGATMLGAFFILTDPVSASTTNKGRLIYGALIGVLVFLIRSFGGYPDAIAFAVLIGNMAVPLIDYYTRPPTYGHARGQR